METINGYVIMKLYSSGSKSDGYVAYLFVAPNNVYKLYRAEELPIADTFFNEYHLKFVNVNGILHEKLKSINVESIELSQDPFLSTDEQEQEHEKEDEVKNEEE